MTTDVVVITGAGGAMGLACVAAFAGRGHLVLSDVGEDRLGQAVAAAEAAGVATTGLVCDVTDTGAVSGLFAAAQAAGSLRSLVHTVGLSPTMAEGRRVLEVDLVGAARVLDAATGLVGPGTAGVFVSSMAGHAVLWPELNPVLDEPLAPDFLTRIEASVPALDGATGYVLAKRGVIRLCERWAGVWGRRGGRLVSVSPGLIDTAMGRLELERFPDMAAMGAATPVHRPGTGTLPGLPTDIASLAAFLCSDAASFISGCDILVDGGLVGAGKHPGAPS
ncbi:MAG TPA: SDR family oxidoreductase [Acidimicrobiales bacterium]|nr:SDR family oxidoreductase [Acidimicrobiales bacterium]